MKFYVIQPNDKRYEYAARLLEQDGHQLTPEPEQAEAAVLPMMACQDGVHITGTALIFDDFAARLPENGVIFGWLNRESPRPALNYMADRALRYLNAVPTAEGALLTAIENLPRTIWNSRCLVLGRGHVGAYLARLLQSLGAKVTLAARKPEDLAYGQACGYETAELSRLTEVISRQDLIFNDIPARVLGEAELREVRSDSLVIELAAANGAIDLQLAEKIGANVVVGGSLPGKYSPETAARFIVDAIYRTGRAAGLPL